MTYKKKYMNPIYENEDLLELSDGSLHPGGDALTDRLLSIAKLPAGSTILDIGCGTGRTVRRLLKLGYDAYGIDRSEKMVRIASSPRITCADALSFSGTYDAILTECVLSLIPEQELFLLSLHGHLKPGGMLLLNEPVCRTDKSYVTARPSCISGLKNAKEFSEMLCRCGYSCLAQLEDDQAIRNYLAMLIMVFGSADAFFSELEGSCAAGCPKSYRLGYLISVWKPSSSFVEKHAATETSFHEA